MDRSHFKSRFEHPTSRHSSQNPIPPDLSPDGSLPNSDRTKHTPFLESYQARIMTVNARRLERREMQTIFSCWFDFVSEAAGRSSPQGEHQPASQSNPTLDTLRLFDTQGPASSSEFRLFDTQATPSIGAQVNLQLSGAWKHAGYGAPEAVVAPTSPNRAETDDGPATHKHSLETIRLSTQEKLANRVGRRSRTGYCCMCFKGWLDQVRESKRLFLVADAIVLRWDTFACYNVITSWSVTCMQLRHLRWVYRALSNKSIRRRLYFHFACWRDGELNEPARAGTLGMEETEEIPRRIIQKEEGTLRMTGRAPPAAVSAAAEPAIEEQGGPNFDTVFISGLWNLSAIMSPEAEQAKGDRSIQISRTAPQAEGGDEAGVEPPHVCSVGGVRMTEGGPILWHTSSRGNRVALF